MISDLVNQIIASLGILLVSRKKKRNRKNGKKTINIIVIIVNAK